MLLKRYYAQLSIVNNKFHYTSRSCDLKFTWADTFTKSNVTGDIQLELDSILHNIGALHSELGAIGQRSTSESIKVACTHFQCAAWVFKKLKENTHFKSKDLSQDLMSFNHYIMLAQAQECFLEKAILDKRNASITAKIAAEVVAYYDYLIVILVQAEMQEKESLFNKTFKEWRKFFEFKISFYSALCSYFMGLHEEVKWGERVAWLKDADEKLRTASKLAKTTNRASVIEVVEKVGDLAKKALEQTVQTNDFVYHDLVPTPDKLTAIKGVSLVKEIAFSVSDAEVMGKDIFGKLVPIEAYETVSIYSDSRDKMWREIKCKIDDKNEELVKFMSVIQLDKDNVRQRKFNVPERLASICASLNASTTNFLTDVRERLDKLDELCKEVDTQFKELEKTIEEEELHEKTAGKPKVSISTLRAEFDRNYGVHKSAMTSNQSMRDVIRTHEKDIDLLMNSSVQDLERLFSMSAEDLPMDQANLAELEKLFDKIDEMKKQRAFLENKLKQSIKNDDILKSAVAHSESEIKSVFEKENEKFDVDLKYLEQNMTAQDNILSALTKANANYADTRKAFIRVERLRNEKIESFYESYENVQSVLVNLDKGIEFYANLKQVIQQLKAKIAKHVEDRKANQSAASVVDGSLSPVAGSLSPSPGGLPSNSATASPLNRNTGGIASTPATTSSIAFSENRTGPAKLKDFLPYYDPSRPRVPNVSTHIPANIPSMPTAVSTGMVANMPPSNLPSSLPGNLPSSQPQGLMPQVSNYSSNLPPSGNAPVSNMPSNLPSNSMSGLTGQPIANPNMIPLKPSGQYQPSMNSPYYPAYRYPTNQPQAQPTAYSNQVTNYANPYTPSYPQPATSNLPAASNLLPSSSMVSSTIYNQPQKPSTQLPTSTHVPSSTMPYYMPLPQQYLPAVSGVGYHHYPNGAHPGGMLPSGMPSGHPGSHPVSQPANPPHLHSPATSLNQPTIPPHQMPNSNPAAQNLTYGMQNMSLNDSYSYPNCKYRLIFLKNHEIKLFISFSIFLSHRCQLRAARNGSSTTSNGSATATSSTDKSGRSTSSRQPPEFGQQSERRTAAGSQADLISQQHDGRCQNVDENK